VQKRKVQAYDPSRGLEVCEVRPPKIGDKKVPEPADKNFRGTGLFSLRYSKFGNLPYGKSGWSLSGGVIFVVFPFVLLWFNGVMQNALLAFVEDNYEDLELWYPKLRLEEAGYAVRLAAPEIKTFSGKHGYPAKADLKLEDARASDFSGLLIPGGFMPDKLRRDAKALSLTREFFEDGKMVAFICHGAWIPISAKVLKGRHATGSRGVKDDLENAGALWIDEPVVMDGNLISSRTPLDLPHFAKAMVEFLAADAKTRAPARPVARAGGEKPGERGGLNMKKVMLRDVLK
jgi:protease I